MDRSRADNSKNRRCGYYNSTEEPEYDVVDDQEEMLNVCIFPAKPINEEREYADRNPSRSSLTQGPSSHSSGNFNILPREIPFTSGPAINRDLKPGRRKNRLAPADKKSTPVQPQEQSPISQHSLRYPPPLPQFTLELENCLSRLTVHEPYRTGGQRTPKKAELSPHIKGLQRAGSSHHNSQRHSLDLETHDLQRPHQNLERVPSKRHHEWPQTKEDIDQHDFIPMEKPKQTYCEEDWYVGACNRADAEHALHLMNRDGAFLVRDCSNNSNSEPLVLAVYHEKKVYNVKIRFIESMSKYTLGQRSNDMFDSVADIINFHSIFPIILISGRNMTGSRYPENCVLTYPVTKRDVDMLLQ